MAAENDITEQLLMSRTERKRETNVQREGERESVQWCRALPTSAKSNKSKPAVLTASSQVHFYRCVDYWINSLSLSLTLCYPASLHSTPPTTRSTPCMRTPLTTTNPIVIAFHRVHGALRNRTCATPGRRHRVMLTTHCHPRPGPRRFHATRYASFLHLIY